MQQLFVTSFNERIFKLSGLRLLSTFVEYNINAHLLICYEDEHNTNYLDNIINLNNSKFIFYNLSNNYYLNNFLDENKDVIIKKHGGLKSEVYDNEWNNGFSLWFRKIASLKYALDTYNLAEYLIWIDADCFFIKTLNMETIVECFENTYCFYHLGEWRYNNNNKSIESGFIGFKKEKGYELLYDIINEYKNKKYLKYERWDDGHIMGQIILNSTIKSIDLASNVPKRTTWNVIDKCLFKRYIVHNKGCHHSLKKENMYKISDSNKLMKRLNFEI
jgi:hypothetical protein